MSHFSWNMMIWSHSRSLMSICLPFLITSGCLRTKTHPVWLNSSPLPGLYGSALVSVYLWWRRWSRTHLEITSSCYVMCEITFTNNTRPVDRHLSVKITNLLNYIPMKVKKWKTHPVIVCSSNKIIRNFKFALNERCVK